MSCRQYRDSRLGVATLTAVVATPADPGNPANNFTAAFQRLKLIDSCGRATVCDGNQNDSYSTTQESFYNYPIFFNQPDLDDGLYFLLLAPVCCPCAVRVHGLVVGTQPDGTPWLVTGIEGHSNRCRRSAALPHALPAYTYLPLNADGKHGDPATITITRAVAGGPATNEEQLVTLGPGNCFGYGGAVIHSSVFGNLGFGPPDPASTQQACDMVTPGLIGPGVRITRESAGFRLGYFGAHGRQSMALPTLVSNGLRSGTIPPVPGEGYLYVAGAVGSGPAQYTLDASAGCTGHLGGTWTSGDGSQTVTVTTS